jgi:hypothetical protein
MARRRARVAPAVLDLLLDELDLCDRFFNIETGY